MSIKELDEKIKIIFNKVQLAKEEVEKNKKIINKDWLTKGIFEINGVLFNLKISSKRETIDKLAEIIILKDSFYKSVELLDTKEEFKIGTNSFENILEDFKKRVAILEIKNKEKELELLIEKLNLIVPEDLKKERILKEIEEQFNNL